MSEQRQTRMTRQKKVIYGILFSTDTHPTAEWIYQEAKKQLPDISLGTVYRNLQILRDDGRILELNYGKGHSRFDGTPTPHYHFVCERCGRVLDFAPEAEQVSDSVLEGAPGQVLAHRLECYGICKDCLR